MKRWVFGCLIAIIFGIIFLFFKSGSKPAYLNSSISSKPSLEIKGFHLIETNKGEKKWELNASKADIYQKEIRLKEVRVKFFHPERAFGAKDESYLIITADKGNIEKETKDINVEGAVLVETADGALLKTDSLVWCAKKGVISTRSRVNFTKDNVAISGRDLEVDPEKETITLKEVRMVVRPDS
ncbi:MAG: LPS export ABC transporter periplasmic protein LptC [bacterium]|nr:LPS export ABC transporter periplasmic protein LptC [bacterium]